MATVDRWKGYQDNPLAGARNAMPIVPSDGTPLPIVPKRIYVGGGGQVTLRAVDSSVDAVYLNVPPGRYLEVQALYVRFTGTDATFLVAEI